VFALELLQNNSHVNDCNVSISAHLNPSHVLIAIKMEILSNPPKGISFVMPNSSHYLNGI